MATKYECKCALCDPQEGEVPHVLWGYDTTKAHAIPCDNCGELIACEFYVEHAWEARFGGMHLRHWRCETAEQAKDRGRLENNQLRRLNKEQQKAATKWLADRHCG